MTLQLNEQEHQLLKNVLHALYKTFRREPGMNIGSCQCSNVYPDDLKTLIDIHDRLADGTKQPEKVWVFTQESNVDGEYLFNVNVCKDKETAIRMMKQEIDTLLDETTPYEGARQWMDGGDGLNMDDCPIRGRMRTMTSSSSKRTATTTTSCSESKRWRLKVKV